MYNGRSGLITKVGCQSYHRKGKDDISWSTPKERENTVAEKILMYKNFSVPM
jgi:hypothetical protein